MNKRNQRIEAFINSLETVESDGCQSILLTTDMCAIGGDVEGANVGKCTNTSDSCGGSTNIGECTNTAASCVKASNSGSCVIKDPAPGIETNLITSNCGQ